ncbi:MAG: biopolymer transporter ExbD [Candidatus Aureabacteria bacterium]|nr:biopolymer transporter ExbD [Candidatus Auribacterota bacterium]NLW94316.1 biopolymer transporter ExbD [Chlamydiota bacterium]HOE27142.1 biopolymer transporter ExbD [bacterium]HQM52307.1 biopolymer transporter ExbD [bacterium]
MRRRARGAKLIADINITPLTDVALGVLLIFMVAAPVIYQSSIQVRLPKTVTAQKPPRTVTVTVNAAGEVAFEERRYRFPDDGAALGARLAEVSASAGDSSIVINGDRDVRYDAIVQVIDTALQAGISRIILATEHEKAAARRGR